MKKTVVICRPCGVCAGVRRALCAMENLLSSGTGPIYLLHELVHNRPVMEKLYARGVHLVSSPAEVPRGATVVLSAHGTEKNVIAALQQRDAVLLDTICPWVQANLHRCSAAAAAGRTVLLLGDAKHAEVKAMRSFSGPSVFCVGSAEEAETLPVDSAVTAIAQTTLDTELLRDLSTILRRRFQSAVQGPEGVCFATENRQKALRLAAPLADGVVILGSPHSANASHLIHIAEECGLAVHLMENPDALADTLPVSWTRVLLSAAASVPDAVLSAALDVFDRLGFERQPGPLAAQENAIFPAPEIAKAVKEQ